MRLHAPSMSVLALAASIALAQQPAPANPQQPPKVIRHGVQNPAVVHPMTDLHPTAILPVAGTPDWSVITPTSVWVSSARVNHVVELNALTNQPGLVADVKRPCSGLAFAFGSLWIPSCGDKTLIRLDPATAKPIATLPVEPEESEGGITIGAGSVWIVAKPGRLVRIDPATNTVVASLDLPKGAANPTFGGNAIWISSHEQNTLLRIDPQAVQLVSTIPIGPKPRFLTVGAGSVWTLNQDDGSVSRVDIATGKLLASIPCGVPGEGGEITFGAGRVWATMFDFPLTEIDPATNSVVAQYAGKGGDGLRFGLDSLWLSNLLQGTVWRINPKLP